jgi:hypothetical protein
MCVHGKKGGSERYQGIGRNNFGISNVAPRVLKERGLFLTGILLALP